MLASHGPIPLERRYVRWWIYTPTKIGVRCIYLVYLPILKSKFQPKKAWICLDYLTTTKKTNTNFPKKKWTCHGLFLPPKEKNTYSAIDFQKKFHGSFRGFTRTLRVFLHPSCLRWQEGISVGRRPVIQLQSPRKSFWKGGWGCSIGNPKKNISIYVRGKITIDSIDLHWIITFRIDFRLLFYDDRMGTWKTKSKWGNFKNPPTYNLEAEQKNFWNV